MDFGPNENQRIRKRLKDYRDLPRLPFLEGYDRKVMITGFGLFKGAKSNITSCLVRALADPTFYLSEQDPEKPPRLGSLAEVPRGEVLSDIGVDRSVRLLQLGDTKVLLYLLNVDVLWDFAAGVIQHELQVYEPDALLMMGQGKDKVILEAGACNQATQLSGFARSGDPCPDNLPPSSQLLEGGNSELKMHWPRKQIADRIEAVAERLGVEVILPEGFRSENTYICNQISYASLLTSSGTGLNLAGELTPCSAKKSPQHIGFLHLPLREKLSEAELRDWMAIMTSIIYELA